MKKILISIALFTINTGSNADDTFGGFQSQHDKLKGYYIVDAHDPSSARNGEVPPPNEIPQDIQALKDWSSALKDRQKSIK